MKLVPKSPLAKEKKQPPRKDFQDRWPGLPSKHTTGKNQSPFPSRTNNYTLIEIIRGGLKSKFRTVMGFFFNLLRDTANAPDTILIRAAIKPGGWNDGAASAGRLHISIVNRRNVLSSAIFKFYLYAHAIKVKPVETRGAGHRSSLFCQPTRTRSGYLVFPLHFGAG